MTGQYRLCVACLRQWIPRGQAKCDACSPGRVPNNTTTKHQRPKLDPSQGLPEDLSGYTVEDFL